MVRRYRRTNNFVSLRLSPASMAGPDVLIEPETVLGIPATLELRQAAIVCPVDLFDAVKIIEQTARLRRKGWPALFKEGTFLLFLARPKKSAGNRSAPPDRLSTDKPHFARSSRGCAGQTRCNARDIFHCFHARLVLNSSSGRRRRACPSLVKCRKTYYARLDPVVADRRSGQRLVDPRKA